MPDNLPGRDVAEGYLLRQRFDDQLLIPVNHPGKERLAPNIAFDEVASFDRLSSHRLDSPAMISIIHARQTMITTTSSTCNMRFPFGRNKEDYNIPRM